MFRNFLPLVALGLAGCVTVADGPQPVAAPERAAVQPSTATIRAFQQVSARIEPVAERECRARTRRVSCDYQIRIDTRAGQPANAFQSVDSQGRPLITVTTALLGDMRNRHEMAFVLGHEAAHHIRGHLPKKQQTAVAGALLLGVLAAAGGAEADAIQSAQDIGATVGARAFSKEMELEADQLGTVITARAGYDPVVGAAYFARIPDPGDRFLGTHPPNAKRQKIVAQTAAGL